jgi:uncharacterized protein YbcC (UPF0753/DUF2309 family)
LTHFDATTEKPTPDPETSHLNRLRAAIDHAAHLLPAQGPITVFIHHNTLHAFENMPFEQAVVRGAVEFGCQPYLSTERYREAMARGRIRIDDLRNVLLDDLGWSAEDPVIHYVSRLQLRLAMLEFPMRTGSAAELQWFLADTDALRRIRPEASAASRVRLISETRRWVMRDLRSGNGRGNGPAWLPELFARFRVAEIESWNDSTWEAFCQEALWNVCRDGVRGLAPAVASQRPQPRPRDRFLAATGVDLDPAVNDILIRFTAAFLDQGVSHWPLPERERGFFQSFCTLYRGRVGPPDPLLAGLNRELARVQDCGLPPLELLRKSIQLLGIPDDELEEFIAQTLLALRGWGGMILQVEGRADRVALSAPAGSLLEFLAVRLIVERCVLTNAARDVLGFAGSLAELQCDLRASMKPAPPSIEERAFPVFQLAQVLAWTPDELYHLAPADWERLVGEIEAFGNFERRRVFQLAYERRFYSQTLDALALHERRQPQSPRFQAVTCLDEREESFRRHLEEVAPDCETFGAAGFFAVPMYYRGAADATFVPLCPIVITPRHWVTEDVDETHGETHRRLRRADRAVGTVAHKAHVGTRTFALGALLTATLGVLASIPLVARILFPRLTARLRQQLGRLVRAQPKTTLKLDRTSPVAGPQSDQVGFTLEEKAAMAERLLRDIGLINRFARLVLVIGHGSSSLNNPHKSAYDCGACGGSPGAANARASARILNDLDVRARLAANGIVIPPTTWFIGGVHNTCNDSVSLADLDLVPASHESDVQAVLRDLEETSDRNAHERCRRFMSAPLTLSPQEARQHVEGRSEDLAQSRPELGHATNAICVVGRRERTRGLFLDRRAFLASYDPTQDTADAAILTRTMAAVFPVCGGINLEYYFSHIDPAGYGCGTKLPHNITALLGVMDGAMSDLRTGLPWQMTEIHEPVRLLIVCETTAEIALKMLERNPPMMQMAANGWVNLAVLDPVTRKIKVFRDGAFHGYLPTATELPRTRSSIDWYRGWRDHLEFAELVEG